MVDFGFDQISAAAEQPIPGTLVSHDYLSLHVKVELKGYLYVYLSNEQSVQTNVYFDDLRIVHYEAVEQMSDYYPFGLTFNSYQRENSVDQRWKFQGQEHIDDLGLNWDSFKWRNHQPDIGRFFNIDPLAEKFVYNSPYAFSENKVTSDVELEGLESESLKKIWGGMTGLAERITDPDTYSEIGKGFGELRSKFADMLLFGEDLPRESTNKKQDGWSQHLLRIFRPRRFLCT